MMKHIKVTAPQREVLAYGVRHGGLVSFYGKPSTMRMALRAIGAVAFDYTERDPEKRAALDRERDEHVARAGEFLGNDWRRAYAELHLAAAAQAALDAKTLYVTDLGRKLAESGQVVVEEAV